MEKILRKKLIRLAHSKPELRSSILPMLKVGDNKEAFFFGRLKPRQVESALEESDIEWRKVRDPNHDATYDLSGGSTKGGTTIYKDGPKWWYESRYGDGHIKTIADVKEQASYYRSRVASDDDIRKSLIRLAFNKPELRPKILPLLKPDEKG